MASSFPLTIYGGTPFQPQIRSYPVTAGQTFIAGALVYLTSGAVSECGADPAAILGIALCSAANKTLYANSEIPVACLTPEVLCVMSSSTTPTASHPGVVYGIVKSTYWKVDTSDTTNERIAVVDFSPHTGNAGQEWFIVKFLGDYLQLGISTAA